MKKHRRHVGRDGRSHHAPRKRLPPAELPPLVPGQQVSARVVKIVGQDMLCEATDPRRELVFRVPMPSRKAAHLCPQGAIVLLQAEQPLDHPSAPRSGPGFWHASLLHCYGREDDARVQEAFVRLNHEVPGAFPDAVLAQAAALPTVPTAADMAGREDIRHIPLVTIDGEDARDFDDAIHVAPQGTGWLLRVAIADVSHYIGLETGRKTCLDTEARQRGNSWYFPLSVSPMLPEALSNGLCSLKPGVDRLVMLCEIPFAADGEAGKPRFAQAVMRSAARLTYTQIHDCFLDKDAGARGSAQASLAAQPRGQEVLAMLEQALMLSRVLRERRMARGSLDFHQPEPAYAVARDGTVTDIFWAPHHYGHELIEEFMLAANEAVASFLHGTGLPFLYRVHPEPAEESLERLQQSLLLVAPDCLPANTTKTPLRAEHIREILQKASGSDRERVVNTLCLRSLAQACYQSTLLGHFGLASSCYCHFTSPIRRYADLTVHRALKVALGLTQGPLLTGPKLERLAAHCNKQERTAQECEREMARRMACLAMQDRIGEVFSGVVTSVLSFGVFVALDEMPVEIFVQRHKTGRKPPQMGQRWHVRLVRVNLGRLALDGERIDGTRADTGGRQHRAGRTYRGRHSAPQGKRRR